MSPEIQTLSDWLETRPREGRPVLPIYQTQQPRFRPERLEELARLLDISDDYEGKFPELQRSGGPGESHPRAPTDPCVTVSRYTALVVLVLWRAGFTQAQCAKYRGRFPAASAMARMAFLQDRSFLYFFMDHRSR